MKKARTESIIPNLPNEIGLECLARVPRKYHSVLCQVSTTIRSLLRSPEFFATRSRLGLSEEILYFRAQLPFDPAPTWLALSDDSSCRASLPPCPGPGVVGSISVSVGHTIFVMGGGSFNTRGTPFRTPDVWVLDCRWHEWRRGPSMVTARSFARAAVLDGKIYVLAGRKEGPFAEVLEAGQWRALPDPQLSDFKPVTELERCVAQGGRIRAWWSRTKELVFDPVAQAWELMEQDNMSHRTSMCVIKERLYAYNYSNTTIEWMDERDRTWKPLKPWPAPWINLSLRNFCPFLVHARGKLMAMNVTVQFPNPYICVSDFEAWCTQVEDSTCSHKLLSKQLTHHINADVHSFLYFFDWNCFPISL